MNCESTNTSIGAGLLSLTDAAIRAYSAVSLAEFASVSLRWMFGYAFSKAGISVWFQSCWILVSLSVTMVRVTGVFAAAVEPVDDEPLLAQPARTRASVAPAAAVNTAADLTDRTGFSRR